MLLFNSPLSVEKADRLIALLDVPHGGRVLDVGCGSGEFLIRVLESSDASGLGIDRDPACIAAAGDAADNRLPDRACEFREADARGEQLDDDSFDAVICIGSTHAYGSGDAAYPGAIAALRRVVRPGGVVLIGEGYWKQPPDPEYLRLIGEPLGIYHSHAENVSFAETRGLAPLYAAVSSDDEWDHFEWSHKMRIEREAARHPEDSAWAQKLTRARAWRDGYLRWGRETMGFGFYLFTKTPGQS